MSDLTKHHCQLVGIAKTWATKTLPGWCDELHRDLLARHGAGIKDGRISASTMTVRQLAAALDDYERRGWPRQRKIFSRGGTAKKVPPRIAQMVKLWGKLGTAGKVNKATRPALLAFCVRQTQRDIPNLDSLTGKECQQITEALKSWLTR